ncbi:FHA domain-containing protein [Kocuria sp.]|uniref:FHA domain-containing protein n=1 Tax=Kocuria sp. TaxID=1871328 RepID=UPI0026DCCD22|nr:FHA domain-containing protein [Kocuria sp.]MDO4920192.1 FHA domain-containing protein [Kocuria sp.]
MSDQKKNGAQSGPETTSIQIVAGVLSTAAHHKLTEGEQNAVAALPPGSALLLETHGGLTGARFLLDRDEVVAGRHPACSVFLDDVTVSRRHAEFLRRGTTFEVVDHASLNGTYVNSDRVSSKVLENGDEVQIGKFRFTFYHSVQSGA